MQKRQLTLILTCIATTLAIIMLAVLMIPGRSVHYVSSATLRQHFFLHNGWYYDGRDWAFVQGGHKVTGTRQINGVTYHFARDGKQVLPYRISYRYQLSGDQGTSQPASSKYIILHDVGSRANGQQAASFMQRTANSNQAYTNFIVGDGGTVYQMKRPGMVSWGAGVTANQNAPVQIELGHASSRSMFRADYQAYVALARDMAGKYDIPLTLDQGSTGSKGIKSHRWVSQHIWGDHQDPYEYLTRYGVSKQDLADDLAGK